MSYLDVLTAALDSADLIDTRLRRNDDGTVRLAATFKLPTTIRPSSPHREQHDPIPSTPAVPVRAPQPKAPQPKARKPAATTAARYECDYCDRVFRTAAWLARHQGNTHPDELAADNDEVDDRDHDDSAV